MKAWKKVANGKNWQWVWENWTSPAFPYLEDRPWTPIVIVGRLCFSARNEKQWCSVWGDSVGKWYDDVFDTIEYEGEPLYQARLGEEWFLVWNQRESQRFNYQLTFGVDEDGPYIRRFDCYRGSTGELITPIWENDQA